jgi:serine/threonine-protein kinase
MSRDAPLPRGSAAMLGRYELLREVVASGVAATWIGRARDPLDAGQGRHVVILRLHRHATKNVEAVRLLAREARRAAELTHPNVARILEVSFDREPFVVSEHIEGEPLSALLRAAGDKGLPVPVVLRIALDVLEGLAAAHELPPEPLVHGELGPSHIVVGGDGVARLASHGVARAVARLGPHGVTALERLSYAAPERVKTLAARAVDPSPLDPRSDLFSFAVILWEALVGRKLFAATMESALVQKVLSEPIAPLVARGGAPLPPPVTAAIERCLAREPSLRLASARELAMALRAAGPAWIAPVQEVAALVAAVSAPASSAPATPRLADPGPEVSETLTMPYGQSAASILGRADAIARAVGASPPESGTLPYGVPSSSLLGELSLDGATFTLDLAHVPSSPATPRPRAAAPRPSPPRVPAPRPAPPRPPPPKPAAAAPTAAPLPPPVAPLAAPREEPPSPADSAEPPSQQTLRMQVPMSLLRAAAGLTEGLRPGSRLDRYELLLPVHEGARRTVWAARVETASSGDKTLAVKTAPFDVATGDRDERLAQAAIAARACHPNLAEILDYGVDEGVVYVVTEWVEGGSVEALCDAAPRGVLPLRAGLRVVTQACAGLHALHELVDSSGRPARFVHGALSARALLVSTAGAVKLADLGGPVDRSPSPLLTARPDPRFAAPEQRDGRDVDRRADVFAAAALLYTITSGRAPFDAQAEGRAPLAPLSSLVAAATSELDDIVLRALESDPAARFPTALELKRALDEVCPPSTLGGVDDLGELVRSLLADKIAASSQDLVTASLALEQMGLRTQRVPSLPEGEAPPAEAPAESIDLAELAGESAAPPRDGAAAPAAVADPAPAEAAVEIGSRTPAAAAPPAPEALDLLEWPEKTASSRSWIAIVVVLVVLGAAAVFALGGLR